MQKKIIDSCFKRPSGRKNNEIRNVTIEKNILGNAAGSCLISFGNTKVICAASVDEDNLPRFLRNSKQGWLTAEYSMLPSATNTRTQRESARGKQTGRTIEIQRLIGRSLRSTLDFAALGERQITIDCDVIQADGGTRTASITGGYVALELAINKLLEDGSLRESPLISQISAISCGICFGKVLADLDYEEDSSAEVDSNFVMTADGRIVEIQGTAEGEPFTEKQFAEMLKFAKESMQQLCDIQRSALDD